MFRSSIGIALIASFVGLAGCASKAQTIGTATGTVGGAMVGYGLGKAYEDRHD
jgi:hypothetical protein